MAFTVGGDEFGLSVALYLIAVLPRLQPDPKHSVKRRAVGPTIRGLITDDRGA